MKQEYEFTAKIWLYPGRSAWHFVTLPKDLAKTIHQEHDWIRRGFGSIPVEVTIGSTSWKTSIFADSKSESYLLPIKKEVRVNEGLQDQSEVNVDLKFSS